MKRRHLNESIKVVCPFCGHAGFVTIDEGGGEHQEYIEDCPTCCKPRVVHVQSLDGGHGEPEVWVERTS